MDPAILVSVALLALWAVATFVIGDAPGWVHLLLTVGLSLLFWRIAVRNTKPRNPPL